MQELYLDHHPWLQSLLRKRLGNREDAADLAHDTFVRVMRSELSPTDLCEPRGFLATVARGLVADLFRRRTLEQAYLEYLVALPEDQAQAQQAQLEVDALLRALPTKVRQAFLLAQLEELPYAEIARRLGISHRTVSNYLTRAMEHCCLALA